MEDKLVGGSPLSPDFGRSRRACTRSERAIGALLVTVVALLNGAASAQAAPPEALEPPVMSGVASSGHALTSTHGAWAGSEPLSYSYHWSRCNSSGEACSAVSGATSGTYALTGADVGHTLSVAVTAANEEGSQEAESAKTAVIAGTSTAGLADPTQSLLIQPSADPVESGDVDLEDETPVFVVQSMPKPMTVSSVTIGDFARASGCEANPNVQLKVYTFGTANDLSSGKLVATSSSSAPFEATLGGVTWQIPVTELALNSSYGFFIKGSGGCAAAIERSWAHNSGQVNGGSATCDVMLGSSGLWRLWHTESDADSGECPPLGALTGFGASLPTGWAQVDQSGEAFSVDLTPSGCASGLGATETPYGEGHVVCQFPQFTKPHETTPDGWYYGLPWEGSGLTGTPRDLYFRLDPALPPSGRLTSPPSQLSPTAATLEAVISPKGRDTEYQIHWTGPGVSGNLPEHPADAGSGTGDVTVAQRLEGLKPSTTYHYYLTLYTPNDPPIDKKLDPEAYSGTFTTPSEPEAPVARTGSSSEVGVTQAMLDGSVEPKGNDTHYWFEWGTESSLSDPARSANEDLGSGGSEVAVSHRLSDLRPDTTYYYRVVAVNSVGARSEGAIKSFTTSIGELHNFLPPRLEGVVDLGGEVSASPGQWNPEAATTAYQWERCDTSGGECSAITGATDSVYTLGEGDAGSTLRVRESVKDGEGVSGSEVSAVSKVVNPFSLLVWPLSPPTISGVAAKGQTVIADHGNWSGEPPFSYGYQWQRCDGGGGSCADIEGATQSTHVLDEADVGGTIRVLVTATGGGAWDATASDPTAVIVNPSILPASGPTIAGSATYEQTLTAEHGTWTGVEAASYTYQWIRCDASGSNCETLEGQTGETYELSAEDLASTLRVIVTAHGAEGSGEAVSSPSGVVVQAMPVSSAPPSIAGMPIEGQTLHAELGEWTGSNLSFDYQWERCNGSGAECEDIAGATDRVYTVAKEDTAESLRVIVIASNELGSVSETSDATSSLAAKGTLVDSTVPTLSGLPAVGVTLTANHGTWTGGGAIGYSYAWQRCDEYGDSCSSIPGATSATYTLTEADAGHAVSVLVTASDTTGSRVDGSPPSQPVADSGGLAPSWSPTVSGVPQQGESLSATPGTFSGTGSPTYAYRWVRCAADETGCSPIIGATSSSYTLASADVGEVVRVVVTASAGGASADSISTGTGPVSPASLKNVSIPTISGTARAGETMSATTGSWTGTGTLTYAYQWQRCDARGGACSNIEGAVTAEHVLDEADVNATLRVVITANGSWGSGKVRSEPSAVIAPALQAPVNITAPTVEGTDVEGQLLTAEAGGWGGATPISFVYRWNRCNGEGAECVPISGATSATYHLKPSDIGYTFSITVSASNAAGEQNATSAVTSSVSATEEPVLIGLPVISGTAQEESPLTATTGEWSGPEPITYEYSWERCNSTGEECAPVGVYASSYTPGDLDVGQRLRVAVTATNGSGSTVAISPDTAIVKTAAPVAGGPPTIEGRPLIGATLSVNTSAEYSAEPPTVSYEWQRCGAEETECVDVAGATQATYVPSESDVGFGIRVVVKFVNTTGEDVQHSSATEEVKAAGAPIEASAPAISVSSAGGLLQEALSESPYVRGDGAIVTATHGSWYGAQPISYSYQWQRCGPGECQDIPGADKATYIVSEVAAQEALQVIVTATNAYGSSTASAWVNVASNSAPSVKTYPGISGNLHVGSVLSARPGEWIGTPSSYSYQWYRCRPSCTAISGATHASYLLTEADEEREITLLVTATNAHGSDTAAASSEGTVGGPLPVNVSPPSLSGGTIAGERLTANTGTWDNVYYGFEYEWQLCDEAGESCADIPGATGVAHESYTTTAAEVGHRVRLILHIPLGGGGETTYVVGPTSPLSAPEVPAVVSTPTIAGTAQVGQILTAGEGDWSGTPTGYVFQWERCDADGAECSVVPSITPESSYAVTGDDEGHTIRVSVTASNAAGSASATSLATARVLPADIPFDEAPPTIEGSTEAGETLALAHGTWSGAEPITYVDRWERCDAEGHSCTILSGTEGETSYVTTTADAGHTIRVHETATNASGHASASSALAGPITSPVSPSNEELPIIEGTPEAGAELVVSDGSWHGGTITAFSYQWQRCDSEGEGCVNIPGADQQTYLASMEDAGHKLRAVVVAHNLAGEASATSEASATLEAPESPSNTEAPTIEGTPADGEPLYANVGAWNGGSAISFGLQWQRCDAEGGACTDIEGATSSEYDPNGEDVGHTVRLTVAATNAAGTSSAGSGATSVVASASAPGNVVAPKLPFGATPEYGVALGVEAGSWTGHPTETAYQWERCDPLDPETETEAPTCVAIAGATEASYVPAVQDVGYELRVTETVTNAGGGTSQSSERTALSVGYQYEGSSLGFKGVAAVGQAITAEASLTTNAGLPTSTEYRFLRVNSEGPPTELQAGSSPTYRLTGEDEGHVIEIRAEISASRADHGETLETQSLSAETPTVSATIENTTPPTISGTVTVGARLTSSEGTWSAGAEELTSGFEIQWERCDEAGESCVAITDAHGEVYAPVKADEGSTLRVRVSIGETSAVSSATGPVGPLASPAETALPSISGTATNGQQMTGSVGTWTASGPIAYAYQWLSCRADGTNCEAIEGADQPTYDLSSDDVGRTMRFKVVATTSGAVSGTAVSEPTAIVGGLPSPVNEELPSTTVLGPDHVGAAIAAEPGTWKYAEASASEYQWQRCNTSGAECQDIAGGEAKHYDISQVDSGHRLRVVVTATNETGSAEAASDLSPTIQATSAEGEEEGTAANHMVFVSESTVYIANQYGEDAKPILTCSDADANGPAESCYFSHPHISPDGQMVVVEEQPEVPTEDEEANRYGRILALNFDGTGLHVLAQRGTEPNWNAADGTVQYTTANSTGAPEILSVEADGANAETPTPVTEEPGIGDEGELSPNGNARVFVSGAGGEPRLMIGPTGTTEAKDLKLTREIGSIAEPRFTASEEEIVFRGKYDFNAKHEWLSPQREDEIYEVNVDGSGLHPVTSSPSNLGFYTKSSPAPTTNGERIFLVGQKGACPDFVGRGPGISTPSLDSGFECNTSALIEVPASGGEERVVAMGASAVSFAQPHTNLIPGAAPDGWCNEHLHGEGEAVITRSDVHHEAVYETGGDARGAHPYSIGLDRERNYDCEANTTHIYWQPWYNTTALSSTPIWIDPGAERYDGTSGGGKIVEIQPGQNGPYHGLDPPVAEVLRLAAKFPVRAAKTTARDPRIWRFTMGIVPDDSDNAYDLVIQAIKSLWQGPNSRRLVFDQHYTHWLRPGCYPPAGTAAKAASCAGIGP